MGLLLWSSSLHLRNGLLFFVFTKVLYVHDLMFLPILHIVANRRSQISKSNSSAFKIRRASIPQIPGRQRSFLFDSCETSSLNDVTCILRVHAYMDSGRWDRDHRRLRSLKRFLCRQASAISGTETTSRPWPPQQIWYLRTKRREIWFKYLFCEFTGLPSRKALWVLVKAGRLINRRSDKQRLNLRFLSSTFLVLFGSHWQRA